MEEEGRRKKVWLRRGGLIAIFGMVLACGNDDVGPTTHVGRNTPAVRCNGQYNITVTSDFVGGQEEVVDSIGGLDAETVSHAAAAELVESTHTSPGEVRFALAWVAQSDKKVRVRIWDTGSQGFVGSTVSLPYPSTERKWVRHMGFDDDCQAISSVSTCAWFTWEDGTSISSYVNWTPIGPGAEVGTVRWRPGHDGSGGVGVVRRGTWPFFYYERKRLIAWISRDRRTVYAGFLNPDGSPIAGSLVLTNDLKKNGMVAYQTAVEWSSTEERWIVTWGESDESPGFGKNNGLIRSTYVTWNGGWAPPNFIMYCEGQQEKCGLTKNTTTGPTGAKANSECACKGYWLASSYYSQSTDRYRLYHYNFMARLDADAKKVALDAMTGSGGRGTYHPITESAFYYDEEKTLVFTPFQMLGAFASGVGHYRLVGDSASFISAGPVNDSSDVGQAFRSNGAVAAALSAADGQLHLGIVDVIQGGCP